MVKIMKNSPMLVVGERDALRIDFHNNRRCRDLFALTISEQIIESVFHGVRTRQHSDLVGAFGVKHSRYFEPLKHQSIQFDTLFD